MSVDLCFIVYWWVMLGGIGIIFFPSFRIFLKSHVRFFIFIFFLSIICIRVSQISPAPGQTNFIDLASAFLHGKLYFLDPVRVWNDYAIYNGHYYSYFGPFPALLYMPLVIIFGVTFPQQAIIPFITLGVFITAYKICRIIGAREKVALWLATFFIFGTIYLMLALTTISCYNTQLFGLFFLLMAVFLFLKGNFYKASLFLGAAGLTQPTYYPATIFFIIEFLCWKIESRKKIIKIGVFTLIICFSMAIFALYNYLRFGNPLEAGYKYQENTEPVYVKARSYGIFSLKHVPGNLYILLFKAPDPVYMDQSTFVLKFPFLRANEWGMGIFYTSPFLIYLILCKLKAKFVLSSLMTSIFMLLPALLYFGVGRWQYGYRYSLGIYPFLLILLASFFKRKDDLPLRAKILIVYSIIFNLLFMYSIWHSYPFIK